MAAMMPATVQSFDTDRPVEPRILLGIGLRLLAIVALSIMFACVKLAETRGVNVIESLFYRQLIAVPLVLAWVAAGPGFGSLRTMRVVAHASRMVQGLAAMALNFWAMTLLPLAEATAIGFTVPIFATLLAALLLSEPTGWRRWSAVLIGFAGVLIVVQPGGGTLPTAGIGVAIVGAVLTAAVTITIRRLGATEAAATTVFWFTVSSLVPLGFAMLWFGAAHDAVSWAIIGVLGVAGGIGQLTLTAALRLAPVSVVMPMDYTGLIWAALLGWLIFADLPSAATWIGAPAIIGSGLYIAWREHRLSRAGISISVGAK